MMGKARGGLFGVVVAVGMVLGFAPALAQTTPPAPRVVGYYTAYSVYDDYFVTDIPVEQLTHLNYAFIDVNTAGQCVSADRYTDMQYAYPRDNNNERLRGNFKQLGILKEDHPQIGILMTVGGWEYSAMFSDVALTQDARIRFANSCIAFMRDYGFDGIDIDWRYPISGGSTPGRPEDGANFVLLLAELRGQLDYWSERDERPYLLTITAPAVEPLYQNFPLLQLQESLDWINLMSYGFQGEWSAVASHHAPLFGNTKDPRGDIDQTRLNVDNAVRAFLDAGVPAAKINMGIAFFAQAWRRVPENTLFGLYAEAGGVPDGTRTGGILYYRDLVPLLDSPAYTRYFDDEAKAAWMYNPQEHIAISYESQESIRYKVGYVRDLGLGGVMLWELSYDSVDHVLLDAITDAFAAIP
jgi:chitinase